VLHELSELEFGHWDGFEGRSRQQTVFTLGRQTSQLVVACGSRYIRVVYVDVESSEATIR
jgi:hypothetical protein